MFMYVYYILLVLRACTCQQLGKLFYPVYRNYWMGLHLVGSLIYHKWMHVLITSALNVCIDLSLFCLIYMYLGTVF